MSGIVVLGSLHLDLMVEVEDLPARGETARGKRMWQKFGGKGGNQALAAAGAGASVAFVGRIGSDAHGEELRSALVDAGVQVRHLVEDDGVASGMSVATIDAAGDYTAVILSNANLAIDEAQVADARGLIEAAHVLVLQNEIPEAANIEAAIVARAGNTRVLLNAAPARPLSSALLDHVDLLVLNALEAESLGADPVHDLADAERAALGLAGLAATVIVTAGSHGVAWSDDDGVRSLPAHAIQQVSTHGAGDVFIGHLAAALAAGEKMGRAIDMANRAAARHVAGGV